MGRYLRDEGHDFNDTHPELLPGEKFSTNTSTPIEQLRKEFANPTLRWGVVAYDRNGREIGRYPDFYPVFHRPLGFSAAESE